MAYRRSSTRRRASGSRRSYSRGSTRRTSYARRSTASRSRAGRQQTVRVVIEQAPSREVGALPGVPNTVGVAALGPVRKSVF